MNKILLTVISVFILIIAALLVVPSFIDWSQYKEQIKTQVANATGYQLDLNGELRAAFLPTPHVILNDMVVDSADVKGPVSFQGQVERASVSLQLLPLLSGNIAVSDVTLIGPELSLQQQDFTPEEVEAEKAEAQSEEGQSSMAVQIDRLYLENAKITYKPLEGEATVVAFPNLELQANTLYGPYEFDGRVLYNEMDIAFNGNAGEYSKTEAMPVTIAINGDAFNFGFSGVADMTGDIAEFQGELEARSDSLQNLVSKTGGSALPIKDQSFALSGLLQGSQQAFSLENGVFSFGESKGKATLTATALDTDTKIINAGLAFDNALNLDAILNPAGSASSATPAQNTAGAKDYRFLPETMEIPAGMNVTFSLTAPQIRYSGQTIDNAAVTAKLDNGQVSGTVKANNLPGGGSLDMAANLRAESTSRNGASGAVIFSNPALALEGDFALNSLKTVASDWLKLVEASTFENPQMPQSASGQIEGRIQGSRATVSSSKLSLGQYDMTGLSLAYINAAEPGIDLSIDNFEGANLKASGTLDQSQGVKVSASHPNAATFIQIFKPDFEAAPNLKQSFSFQGTVLKNADVINVSGMVAKIGDIDATGNLMINNGGAVPDIKAELAFGNLDTRALLTGEKSTATASGTNAGASKSTAAPWTRDAIDTSFLRSINLNLDAKAQQLVHGTWLINSPVIDINLRDGVLDINAVKGGLFDGAIDMSGRISAKQEGQPLSATAKINAQNVDLNRLIQAALSQDKRRVTGVGSFNMDLQTSGLSSSALVYGLNGDGRINTNDLIIHGIDLGKITEAVSDESLTDLSQAFRAEGQTAFEAVDHPLTIREGTMPVNNFNLVSPTATLISNGEVSFARWHMDLVNTVNFTGEFDDVPSIEMKIAGPLNAPQQNVASDVLRSFITNKYGGKIQDKVQEFIGKELGEDNPASGLINNLLGLPQKQPATQQPAVAPAPAETDPAPAVNDNNVAPQEQAPVSAEPEPAAEPQPQASPEEQLINGLINQFGGGSR